MDLEHNRLIRNRIIAHRIQSNLWIIHVLVVSNCRFASTPDDSIVTIISESISYGIFGLRTNFQVNRITACTAAHIAVNL